MLSPLEQSSRDAALETPEDVLMILGLTAAGWGRRRIAKQLGCSPETVRKYRRQGGWETYGKHRRIGVVDGQCDWLTGRFLAHKGYADVMRQELASDMGIAVSPCTLERAVGQWRLPLRSTRRPALGPSLFPEPDRLSRLSRVRRCSNGNS
ncbi:MAG: helix-turn-helix domain-containing protein [Cyanobium sp. LacPavin_0920_WC12_MAG_62_9]|nr:helix-turn-helix domain-containing protein [Cyanobium sp. LacPavin_0920_WC12_MAG_62_9]